MVEPILVEEAPARVPRPLVGYAMVLTATCMWGLNGTVSKATLGSSHGSGLSSLRLTEVRSTGAALVLGTFLLLTSPELSAAFAIDPLIPQSAVAASTIE